MLREILTINRDIILFIYGQVFFVMGLAIALQSRRNSRLDLARSLRWLAFFGIVHGLYEWGDLFIPLQQQYLAAPWIRTLKLVHLVALGASFACLFQFGVSLLAPLARRFAAAVLRWLPLMILLTWLGVVVFVLLPLMPAFEDWLRVSNSLARYLIGLPGALVAAYALRRYAHERLALLGVPHVLRSQQLAGGLLLLYGIFGGVIAPPVTFFPGNWLNTASFYELTGVPVLVFRSLIGLGLAITIIRALDVFDVETERMIESMEQQQILTTERARIGRDLHDGAIQLVYTAGLLVESAHKQAPQDSPQRSRLGRAVIVLQDAIAMLRRNLGELHTVQPVMSLHDGLQQAASDPRFAAFVQISVDTSGLDCRPLSGDRSEHVLAIVNEALSNVIRHAGARHVHIHAECNETHLRLSIQDDGSGLPKNLQSGYGLRNMRDRARLLGGTLDVADAAKHGTRVQLSMPWTDER